MTEGRFAGEAAISFRGALLPLYGILAGASAASYDPVVGSKN